MTNATQKITGKISAKNVPDHVMPGLSPIDHALHVMDETDRSVWAQNLQIEMSRNLLVKVETCPET